jgi:hypothetical protein
VLHVQVALHRFGALETELVVAFLRPDVVGMPSISMYMSFPWVLFSWPTTASRRALASSGSLCLAELEITLVFTQGDFEDELPQ